VTWPKTNPRAQRRQRIPLIRATKRKQISPTTRSIEMRLFGGESNGNLVGRDRESSAQNSDDHFPPDRQVSTPREDSA
jgi:hypothetical protein